MDLRARYRAKKLVTIDRACISIQHKHNLTTKARASRSAGLTGFQIRQIKCLHAMLRAIANQKEGPKATTTTLKFLSSGAAPQSLGRENTLQTCPIGWLDQALSF